MKEKYYFKEDSKYREERKRREGAYLKTVGEVSREVNNGLEKIEKSAHREK